MQKTALLIVDNNIEGCGQQLDAAPLWAAVCEKIDANTRSLKFVEQLSPRLHAECIKTNSSQPECVVVDCLDIQFVFLAH